MTNTFLTFGRPLEVPGTSRSKAGQHESTSGSLHTKTSHTVQRLLQTLNFLAPAEACSLLTTSETFSSSLQELFTWPETFICWQRAEKDPAPNTGPITSLQAALTPSPMQQAHANSILGAFMELALGI